MEPEDLLPYSQEPATCLYSEPTPPSTSGRSTLILSFHLSLGLPSGLLSSGLPTKTMYAPVFSPPPHVLHTKHKKVKEIVLILINLIAMNCYVRISWHATSLQCFKRNCRVLPFMRQCFLSFRQNVSKCMRYAPFLTSMPLHRLAKRDLVIWRRQYLLCHLLYTALYTR
jgi:hypothetical protein